MESSSDERQTVNQTSSIIESIISQPRAVRRHLSAPELEMRETYLAHLKARGFSLKVLRERAIRIRDVIEFMITKQSGPVTDNDIQEATNSWINAKHVASKRAKQFKATARCWFQFLGIYTPSQPPQSHFEEQFAEFIDVLRHKYKYLPTTIAGRTSCIRRFLVWISPRTNELSKVTQLDIDAFLAEQRLANFSRRTITTYCSDLRAFFRYAERQGWSKQYLSLSITAPNLKNRLKVLNCPPWKTVRALISTLEASDPSECRAKAILLLASLYGMRTCEIVRLTLEDLDWSNEVITIHRAKRGRVQQFPLAYEVGEALILYLKEVRPLSEFRNVFLTLHRPYRPVHNLPQTMAKLLRRHQMAAWPCGLHTFRHACATELLRKGTSLAGIADFLGHRDIRSVSAYAQSDIRSLRNVGNLSLEGVL